VYVLLRLLAQFRVLVVPLLISVLLVALARPLCDLLSRLRLGRFHLPRGLSAALTVLFSLAVLAGLIALISQQVATGFPSLRVQAADGLQDIRRRLADGPLHLTSGQLDSYAEAVIERLRANSDQVVSSAVQVTATAAHVAAGTLLALFSMFFLLSGGDRIWAWTVRLFPIQARQRVDEAGTLAWGTLTSFVRATVVVAAVDGIGVAVVAKLLGVPLPIPLGVLVFLGAFVPILGSLVSGSVAVLVAFVADGPVLALAMLVGVLGVVQLEGHVLQPLLLGRAVQVHPLAVVIVITAGALVAGIPGALFAVPATAVINVVTGYLVRTSNAGEGRDLPAPADAAPADAAPAEPIPADAAPAEPIPADGGRPATPEPIPADGGPPASPGQSPP
jgi:predicted PurR-regulated permease PerM